MTQIGNSGRLAAKASDFTSHIGGTSLTHEAEAIKLDPNLSINSTTCEEVRTALIVLSDYIDEINIEADPSVRGFVRMVNDLGGTGASPNVVAITGDGTNQISITPRNLVFNTTGTTDVELKFSSTSTTAKNIKITAQSSTTGLGGNGGNIILQSGGRNTLLGTSLRGKVSINLSSANIFNAKYLSTTTKIISLFGDATTSEVPGEANDTIFMFNTSSSTDPASNPVGGSHLYSLSGKTRVKHTNGDCFYIGDTPNTWINGSESSGTINKITTNLIAASSPDRLDTYTNENNCIVLVTARIVASNVASSFESAGFILNAAFYQDGSGMNLISTVDTQVSLENEFYNPPTISAFGDDIVITSGDLLSDDTKWLCHAQYTVHQV